jgi:RNA-directed DNA polymerase
MKDNDQQLLLDIFRAYFDTRKNKCNTANALAFEEGYEEKLFLLHEDIVNRRYKVRPSICFIVNKPVKREIFAADFRDRIVHHLIYNYLNPSFENHFIKDSYSCRKGKGTSYGIRRVDHFIRSCSENYQKECWIMKLDIHGYFMAIDKKTLYRQIEGRVRKLSNSGFDVDIVLYLVQTVLFSDPTQGCRVRGSRENWISLPKSKSLFCSEAGKGLPVGNLTSQLFANVYLDEFDHYVSEELGVKYYGRYVDDMVFVHKNKAFLKNLVGTIGERLQSELGLELHPRKMYLQRFENGLYFLGVFIKPWRIYIGRKTKQNFYEDVMASGEDSGTEERQISSINSYLGIMKHYHTYKLRKKITGNFSKKFLESFSISSHFEKVELKT